MDIFITHNESLKFAIISYRTPLDSNKVEEARPIVINGYGVQAPEGLWSL